MDSAASLDDAITRHVATVVSTASSVAAGGEPTWDELLVQYGVAALDRGERAMIVARMHVARGAVPAEVRLVLQSIARWAQGELDRMLPSDHDVERVRRRIVELVDRETASYERTIGLGSAPTLGSIFANAQKTSKEGPHAKTHREVVTLTCVNCGGPQEQPLDFICRYCRRPIAGTVEP